MSPFAKPGLLLTGLLALAALPLVAVSRSDEPKDKASPTTTLYHSDRQHLWNRVHAALLMRIGPDGKPYGEDRLEPLLWLESKHLLEGKPAERAVAVLEEFDKQKGETLIDDPLKRAVLQRDLWLVASWLSTQSEDARKRLEVPLAKVIRRLALKPEEVAKLPDNYAAAVASKVFAARFDPEKPEQSYLPPELFRPDGPWVCVGRKDGPTAPLHLDVHNAARAVNPFANSAFLIFLKLPDGREATLDFLKKLAAFEGPLFVTIRDEKDRRITYYVPNPALPQMPRGTEVALVRRALLIDSSHHIVASPITESVQIRVTRVDMPKFTPETFTQIDKAIGKPIVEWHAFTEFQMRRGPLFAGQAGGLRDVSGERDFKTGFNSHGWDEFTTSGNTTRPFPERSYPFKNQRDSCVGCHQLPGVYSFNSFHMNFSTSPRSTRRDLEEDNFAPKSHVMLATTVPKVEEVAVKWREERPAWKALRKLLPE